MQRWAEQDCTDYANYFSWNDWMGRNKKAEIKRGSKLHLLDLSRYHPRWWCTQGVEIILVNLKRSDKINYSVFASAIWQQLSDWRCFTDLVSIVSLSEFYHSSVNRWGCIYHFAILSFCACVVFFNVRGEKKHVYELQFDKVKFDYVFSINLCQNYSSTLHLAITNPRGSSDKTQESIQNRNASASKKKRVISDTSHKLKPQASWRMATARLCHLGSTLCRLMF